MCIKGFMVYTVIVDRQGRLPPDERIRLSLATMNASLIPLLENVLDGRLVLPGVIHLLVDRYNC